LGSAADNEKDSIGSAHAEAPAGMPGKAGVSTADRILFIKRTYMNDLALLENIVQWQRLKALVLDAQE
jgi:hypothetical protein